MKEVIVKDADLQQAAMEGMDAFVNVFVKAIYDTIGGELTPETMAELNADQMTLLAWDILHQEVMDGGFVQFEEEWTEDIAHYIDDHLEKFATIQ